MEFMSEEKWDKLRIIPIKHCWNCEEKITKQNRKKHYPVNSGLFCKD